METRCCKKVKRKKKKKKELKAYNLRKGDVLHVIYLRHVDPKICGKKKHQKNEVLLCGHVYLSDWTLLL